MCLAELPTALATPSEPIDPATILTTERPRQGQCVEEVRMQRRIGLGIAGASIFGGTYMISVFAGTLGASYMYIPIVGPVASVLADMVRQIREHKDRPDSVALQQWWRRIDEWRAVQCLAYDRNSSLIKPQFAIETLYKVTGGDIYLTSDVGQHQMFAAQFFPFDQPRRWINSGGLGTMGFGLPAAMGVQLAFPQATVACVSGEASILMCIQEMATCKQYSLPIKVILLNNGYMGMVRQWQEFFYESRYAHSYVDALPDFVKLTESFGHVGMRVERPGDLEGAMREAFAMKDRFVFMDIVVDPAENVYPMIEAGKGHHEMHLSPERELA